MKIIDLLVKIANGEEVPKKIRYRDNIWEYTSTILGKGYQYYSECYQEWKTLQNQVYLEECLNDEVEIIEEPILNDKEREYLSAVIKPFRDKVLWLKKSDCIDGEYIILLTDDTAMSFPNFNRYTLYKGMELYKEYTLEELEI